MRAYIQIHIYKLIIKYITITIAVVHCGKNRQRGRLQISLWRLRLTKTRTLPTYLHHSLRSKNRVKVNLLLRKKDVCFYFPSINYAYVWRRLALHHTYSHWSKTVKAKVILPHHIWCFSSRTSIPNL